MQNVLPELFTLFCAPLSPEDLLTLSQVCRKFREYLCAPNSFSTQQIWKKSRLRFMPGEDMPPPEGMSEEKYVSLLMTERGCQFCKCRECKIYWEFEVRCCYECFSKKTISFRKSDFPFRYPDYPQLFLGNMPCICSYIDDKIYWKEQIEIAYSQYKGFSNENLQSWLDDKKRMSNSLTKYAEQRKFKEEIRQKFERELFSWLQPSPPLPPRPSIPFSPNSKPKPSSICLSQRRPRLYHETFSSFYSYSFFDDISEFIISYFDNIENIKLIQFHIQRLENYEQENKNIIRNSDELKKNDFINSDQTKKNKREYLYSNKHNEFHIKGKKGKNTRNKFAHKYS